MQATVRLSFATAAAAAGGIAAADPERPAVVDLMSPVLRDTAWVWSLNSTLCLHDDRNYCLSHSKLAVANAFPFAGLATAALTLVHRTSSGVSQEAMTFVKTTAGMEQVNIYGTLLFFLK